MFTGCPCVCVGSFYDVSANDPKNAMSEGGLLILEGEREREEKIIQFSFISVISTQSLFHMWSVDQNKRKKD